MSRHGLMIDEAIETMPADRRDELRQAAQTVADAFGMTRTAVVSVLCMTIQGSPWEPEFEAAISAMNDGEDDRCEVCDGAGLSAIARRLDICWPCHGTGRETDRKDRETAARAISPFGDEIPF